MHPEPIPQQQELELPFLDMTRNLPLLPARMINEYAYCPRLAYLMWVQGEWDDSSDTVEGRHVHRRVDKPGGKLPVPRAEASAAEDEGAEMEKIHARSINLSSNRLGLIAKLDLVEGEGNRVTPVDYKRGKRPHLAQGAYDPERAHPRIPGGQPQVSPLLAGRHLPARRGQLLPRRRQCPSSSGRRPRHRHARVGPGLSRQGRQERRAPGDQHRRRQDRERPPHRLLTARPVRQRLPDQPRPHRADEPQHPRELAQLWWLVHGTHRRHRSQERRA